MSTTSEHDLGVMRFRHATGRTALRFAVGAEAFEAFADFITSFRVVESDRFLRARRLWSAMTADERASAMAALPTVRSALAASITDPLQPDTYLAMRLWFETR